MRTRRACVAVVWVCLTAMTPTLAQVKEGVYVTARDGHFHLGDERIRFYGVQTRPSNYYDREHIDALVDRVRALGFNAVRPLTNQSQFREPAEIGQGGLVGYTKDDGSVWDAIDYFFSRLREEGIYCYGCPEFGGLPLTPDSYSVLPDEGDEAQWRAAVAELPLRHGFTGGIVWQLAYFDDRIAEVYLQNIRDVLNHVNQHTGKRYAEDEFFAMWQVTNETARGVFDLLWNERLKEAPEYFQQKILRLWNDYLRERYRNDDALRQAWGGLDPGESLSSGTVKLKDACWYAHTWALSPKRYEDTLRFGLSRWTAFTERAIATMRAQAPEGVGINVIPIIAGANDGNNFPVSYANSLGDVMACNDYHVMLTTDRSSPLYPWRSRLTEPPRLHSEFWLALADKPFVLYESNLHKPARYRAEYPLCNALEAVWQDYDGLFLHAMAPSSSDLDAACRMPLGYSDSEDFWDGCKSWTDEVQLAGHRTASAVFRNASTPTAESPTLLMYGGRAMKDPSVYTFAKRFHDPNRQDPVLEWTQGVRGGRLIFDMNWDGTRRVAGPVDERPQSAVRWGLDDAVVWDWQRGQAIVDAPECKALMGFGFRDLDFRDGVNVRGIDRDYVCLTLVSEDGLPIASSRQMVFSCMSTAQNTGEVIDPSRMVIHDISYQGPTLMEWPSVQAVTVDEGTAPVLTDRVSCEVTLPPLPGRLCRKYDFLLQLIAEEPADVGFSISSDEPVFYCELVAP